MISAVGTTWYQGLDIPGVSWQLYNGFLMSNDCKLIAENGSTQDKNQLCYGGYGAAHAPTNVICDGSHKYVHHRHRRLGY